LRRFFVGGLIYDMFLEFPLKKIKAKVAQIISEHDLYPVLDICCGSGVQCSRVVEDGDKEVYGLDLDMSMIQYAALKYPKIPFVCADAAEVPLKDSSIKGAILSFALHDKLPEKRIEIIQEVKRVLTNEGRIVFVDFEPPWSMKSRIAKFYVSGIERMAGKEHFKNGRQFLRTGGMRAFAYHHGLEELERHNAELAHTSIVVARFAKEGNI
jgi:ubiquinone/menaquinone biosynthesis C-methylase UbiE